MLQKGFYGGGLNNAVRLFQKGKKQMTLDLGPIFQKFLYENHFLPLDAANSCWRNMKVVHYKEEPTKDDIKLFRKSIERLQVRGVYAYITKDNSLLYFGKFISVCLAII